VCLVGYLKRNHILCLKVKWVTYLFKYPTNFSLFLSTRTGVHLWRMYGFTYMKRKHYNKTDFSTRYQGLQQITTPKIYCTIISYRYLKNWIFRETVLLKTEYTVKLCYWKLNTPWNYATENWIYCETVLLKIEYTVKLCYWKLNIPWKCATENWIYRENVLLKIEYTVKLCYWKLNILWNRATENWIYRETVLLKIEYTVKMCYWKLNIPWNCATWN